MKPTAEDKFKFLTRTSTLALLFAPILGFIVLHLVLEKLGYDLLPLLPIVALVVSFFYAYHVTNWLKNR